MLKQKISRVILIRSILCLFISKLYQFTLHTSTNVRRNFNIDAVRPVSRAHSFTLRDTLHQVFLNYLKRLATVIGVRARARVEKQSICPKNARFESYRSLDDGSVSVSNSLSVVKSGTRSSFSIVHKVSIKFIQERMVKRTLTASPSVSPLAAPSSLAPFETNYLCRRSNYRKLLRGFAGGNSRRNVDLNGSIPQVGKTVSQPCTGSSL